MNIESGTNDFPFILRLISFFFHRIPSRVFTDPFSVPTYHSNPHFAKLPNCRCVRRWLSYTAPLLPRTRGNCGKSVSVQTIVYFSDSSMSVIKESGELASHSMVDVKVSARLSGHPSKYWLHEALLDFNDRRSRALTAHLPMSVAFV